MLNDQENNLNELSRTKKNNQEISLAKNETREKSIFETKKIAK